MIPIVPEPDDDPDANAPDTDQPRTMQQLIQILHTVSTPTTHESASLSVEPDDVPFTVEQLIADADAGVLRCNPDWYMPFDLYGPPTPEEQASL